MVTTKWPELSLVLRNAVNAPSAGLSGRSNKYTTKTRTIATAPASGWNWWNTQPAVRMYGPCSIAGQWRQRHTEGWRNYHKHF